MRVPRTLTGARRSRYQIRAAHTPKPTRVHFANLGPDARRGSVPGWNPRQRVPGSNPGDARRQRKEESMGWITQEDREAIEKTEKMYKTLAAVKKARRQHKKDAKDAKDADKTEKK